MILIIYGGFSQVAIKIIIILPIGSLFIQRTYIHKLPYSSYSTTMNRYTPYDRRGKDICPSGTNILKPFHVHKHPSAALVHITYILDFE
jgi:hypothetical protein